MAAVIVSSGRKLSSVHKLTTTAQELVVRTSQLPPVHLKMLSHAAVARMGA